MKDTIFNSKISFNCQGNLHEFDKPLVMGILNVTPDSFYKDSRANSKALINNQITNFITNKVDIIDVGGYSSRPGANEVSVDEEKARVLSGILAIREKSESILISVDTFRTEVAEIAIKNGANIINDITGGYNNESIYQIAANHQAPYVMMHMRGTPQNMQSKTNYNNLIKDIILFFSQQIKIAEKHGVKDIIIDPGLGFSKTLEQNYEIIKNMRLLNVLKKPVLIGASRKSMLYKLLNIKPEDSLNATTAINTVALMNGANILRVHDVKEAKETIQILNQINLVN